MSVEADVLKGAHHGSTYSSSSTFLEAVGAEVAEVCVGDNGCRHPTEALERLREADARGCRTDLEGKTVVVSEAQTVEHRCETDSVTSLLFLVSLHAPGVPPPMPGRNEVCEEVGNVQIRGSVSHATPPQYPTETVYGWAYRG